MIMMIGINLKLSELNLQKQKKIFLMVKDYFLIGNKFKIFIKYKF